MRIFGKGTATYLYVNGLQIQRRLDLGSGVELHPARCTPNPAHIMAVAKSEHDLGLMAYFLRAVGCQLLVQAADSRSLAIAASNAMWDAVLLGALCLSEASCNFQCSEPAEKFGLESDIQVTNYWLRGGGEVHEITADESSWIESHFNDARKLLDVPAFRDAVHALSSFHWHSMPRARLAILWTGIEGLFGVESELAFRISLHAAHFLSPENKDDRRATFTMVKKLYGKRSKAVHGAKMKGDQSSAVKESAELLLRLIRECVVRRALPDVDVLGL